MVERAAGSADLARRLASTVARYDAAQLGELNVTAAALGSACRALGWRAYPDGPARRWAGTWLREHAA